jgi:hypothetical protein
MSSTSRQVENMGRTIVLLREELEVAQARITELQAAYAAEQAKATRLERAAGALRAENALKRTINRNAIEKWTAARDGLRNVLHDLETGDPSAALSRVRALLTEDGAA